MNDRIRELAEQAGLLYPQFGPTVDTRHQRKKRENIEKFAELIVRECADYMYTNYPNSRYEVNYMRKHMGDPDWNKPIGV